MRASQKRVNTADSLGSFHNIYVTDSAVTVCFFVFGVDISHIGLFGKTYRLSWYRCTYTHSQMF